MTTEWLTDTAEEVHAVAVEKGWYEDGEPNFAEKIALVHSELSEALEEYRNGHDFKLVYHPAETGKPEGIAVELADALIRIMDMSAEWDIPLAYAFRLKLEYNKSRPHRHGGKVC